LFCCRRKKNKNIIIIIIIIAMNSDLHEALIKVSHIFSEFLQESTSSDEDEDSYWNDRVLFRVCTNYIGTKYSKQYKSMPSQKQLKTQMDEHVRVWNMAKDAYFERLEARMAERRRESSERMASINAYFAEMQRKNVPEPQE
jgi:hypothetical protein